MCTNNQTKPNRGRKPLPADKRKIEVRVWIRQEDKQTLKDFIQKLNSQEN